MRKIIFVALAVLLMPFLLMANTALAATSTGPLVQASFSANPVTATPGNDGYIQITLKNAGDAATGSIKISSVSMNSNIIPSGTWIGDISPLGAGDSAISLFKFTVFGSAPSGLYPVTFNINYGASSTTNTISPNAIISVQTPSILELSSIEPSSLKPGDKINLTFTITNKGSNPVANAVFTWTNSGNAILPLGADNRVLMPSIDAGASYKITVEVSISPSAAPGVYPLSITIQYSDKSGANQTINSIAGITVSGETDFDVVAQDSTAGSTTLAVANIGANAGQSIIVSIPNQDNFRAVGTSSSVVGNLNAGDYTLATFQLVSARAAANISSSNRIPANISSGSNENLVVEISYTDALGIRRVMQKNVMIANNAAGNFTGTRNAAARSAAQTNSGGLTYIIIGAVGIVAIVAFFKIRKMRKSENK